MVWFRLNLQTRERDAHVLCDLFLGWGALSASIEYPSGRQPLETPVLETPGRSYVASDKKCTVKVLLEDESEVETCLRKVKEILDLDRLPRHWGEAVEEQDWVRVSRDASLPISIQDILWVVPTWHPVPSGDARHVRLDPGSAFGSGRHPTTRLCLEWLIKEIRGGENVLDYGCGSGILAIAALKLGAMGATGIDLDPQALQVSEENARLNGVDLDLFLCEEAPPFEVDLVVANILANPLKKEASRLAGYTRRGGKLALSGILLEQVEEVSSVYSKWFQLERPSVNKDWACLAGTKR